MTGAAPTSGQLLRRYRRLARLTQEELADRSGYSANYIGKLERDQRQPPLVAIERLAGVLGLGTTQRDELQAARSYHGTLEMEPGLAPLVGRGLELIQVGRHLAGREPPVLLLAGEPGIGKTRLLDEAAAQGAQSGWRVVQSGCQSRAQDPYTPLTDALARSLLELPERERTTALTDSRWLRLLLPELTMATRGQPDSGIDLDAPTETGFHREQQRRLLFAAVASYLRGVADTAGTLLVLDDLQWAGADALDLLATLITPSESPPIRLIGAYRDSEAAADGPLGGFVADLARSSLVRVVSLGPLSDEEAQQLLTDLVPDGDETRRALFPAIVRRAGGVPFFLASYVEELRLRDGPASRSLQLPWSVTQVIRQRVVALSGPVQELLGMAAVIGRVVPRSLLTRVAAFPEEEVLTGLEEAAAVRLLEEDGESGYRFTHDVIRETVEADLSAGRRQLVHRRVGEALEETEHTTVETLAYHFTRSDDSAKALHYLERAGDDAQQRFAHATASDFFRDAIARLDRLDRPLEAAPIRERLGSALFMAAHYDEALDVLARAGAVYRAEGDEEGALRVTGRIADVNFRRGSGHDTIDQVAALVEDSASPRAGSGAALALRQGLFRLLFAKGAYKQLLTAGRAMSRVGRATGNARMAAIGEATQGVALIFLGRLSEGVPILEEALPKGLAAGEPERMAETAIALNSAYLARGWLQRSRALSEQMLSVAQSLNDPVIIACHMVILGVAIHAQGDWEHGRSYLRQADELFTAAGPSAPAVRMVAFCAPPLIWEGEWEDARRSLETFVQLSHAVHAVPSERQALALLAELDLREGNPHAAVTRLEPLADADLAWSYAVLLLSTLAWAYLEVGEVARAEVLAQRAVAQAARTETWFHGISALRVQGMIHARQERYDSADAAYQDGLRRARAMPFPYGEAQLLQAYGLLQRQRGDRVPADQTLREALVVFEELGARKDVERVHAALQGGRPRDG